jgi:hypothetical protein
MLVDHGEIPEDDARNHPEAGMLTRALGHSRMADGRPLVPDVLAEPLAFDAADALVMCSDGLHDLLEDWEIGQVVAGRAPMEAAQELVRLACERGGHDNVTVAVVTAGERAAEYDPEWSPPAEEPPALQVEQTWDDIPDTQEEAIAAGGGGRAPSAAPARAPLVLGIAAVGGVAVAVVGVIALVIASGLMVWAYTSSG